MTLLVARKQKGFLAIVGDTKLTYPYLDRSSPKYGTIKSVILSPQACLSFAGNSYFAEQALEILRETADIDLIVEVLASIHRESAYKTEFLLAYGIPDIGLISLKDGVQSEVETAWIGSLDGFSRFQEFFHKPDKAINVGSELTTMRLVKEPDNVDEEDRVLYAGMFDAMCAVIEEGGVEEVEGFVVPVIYDQDSFKYMSYFLAFTRPIEFQEETARGE